MSSVSTVIETRLQHLETHLEHENPVLLSTVQSFRRLDQVTRRMGLLTADESFATQIPWWPLISVLGTFSAGKSTFINDFLGSKLQRSGNQAVDEKFTVICYSKEQTPHALPGVALDSDPRFPFYKVSGEIEQVARGEGARIDAYLQLKTSPSASLKNKILIDSPGFDADAQRTSTLRITDHIIDLSDLVLVFFDARHPEPGAMRDTLDHLVSATISRPDSGKFLYILNQLDTTAREDNPEEVVAAWQRALGERGLTAGRFYTIYNKEAAIPIDDEALRNRFERKLEQDLGDIHGRMKQVEIERAYRIVGTLEHTARDVEEQVVPSLRNCIKRWRNRTLFADGLVFAAIFAAFLAITVNNGLWDGLNFKSEWWAWITAQPLRLYIAVFVLFGLGVALHLFLRKLAARSLYDWVRDLQKHKGVRGQLLPAFIRSTRPWRSIFAKNPAGWGGSAQRGIQEVLHECDTYVQNLNDRFTNPSGTERMPLDEQAAPETAGPGMSNEPAEPATQP